MKAFKAVIANMVILCMFVVLMANCGSKGGSSDPAINSTSNPSSNPTATTTTPTYSISGTVTVSGTALQGVTLTLNTSTTTTTDASGNYSFTELANGSYTVMPSKSGYTFTPTSKAVTVNGVNVTAQDFTATAAVAEAPWSMLKLPDTGQTTHYSTAFGDDANYSINPPSYTDNGDGTITDNITTLIWQKQDDGTTRTWDAAGTYCTGFSLGGHADWRLPIDIELMSIVDYGRLSPAINTTYFPTMQYAYYWSSTSSTGIGGSALYMYVYRGDFLIGGKTEVYNVRCVRGGQ